jgi:hypothetical protein
VEKKKKKKRWRVTNVGEDVEKMDPHTYAGGNVKWYRHYRKQPGNPQIVNQSYHTL